MRFYLLYKNHGLYDPVLDDTEYIYVPIDPDYLETNKVDNETTQNAEIKSTESTVKNGTSPRNVPELDDNIKFKANFHEALLKLSDGDLPETARFKLPISEDYDPDGKKITKLQKLYTNKVTAVDLNTILGQIKQDKGKTVESLEKTYKDMLETELKSQKQDEMTKKEFKYSHEIKGLTLETLKNTASRILTDSINKAATIASDTTQKVDPKTLQLTKDRIHKSEIPHEYLNVKSLKQSTTEKCELDKKDSIIRDIMIEDNNRKDGSIVQEEKEKLNVAKEIKKFESFEASIDSKLNLEERKLRTKQDIEETIEEGTVRHRSERFAKEMKSWEKMTKKSDVSSGNYYNADSNEGKQSVSNLKTSQLHKTVMNVSSDNKKAEQNCFSLGMETVHRLQALCSSPKSKLLLQTFFLKLTKTIVALSKHVMLRRRMTTIPYNERTITIDQNNNDKPQKNEHGEKYSKSKNKFKEDKENEGEKLNENSSHEYKKDYYSSNSKNMNFEGEIIKKEKLSGAKIAQIEGNKPAELTDKMDVVISELQRKSVIEEQYDNKESFQSCTRSSNKSTLDEDLQTSNKNNNTDDHFFDQRSKNFDRRKLFETIEEKTTSMDIKEMISKKHITEYKSTETSKKNENIVYVAFVETKHFPKIVTEITTTKNLFEHDVKTEMKNNENLVYIAIVEAHVYTNKDAIFEEQMRRLSESTTFIEEESRKKSVDLESTKEVTVESDSKSFSLADTAIIEPTTVSLMVQPLPNKQIKYARSATDIEQISKKIAVQNIVDAIEPLLRLETHKFSNKQVKTVIETPMKAIAETTDMNTEEQQIFFNAEVNLTQKSFVSIEKPEPVVEITEITTEESENVPVESSKLIIAEPESIIEIAEKVVAEISEVQTDEAKVEFIGVPEVIHKKPCISMEQPILSVAETILVTAEHTSEDIIVPKVVTDQAKINIGTNIASEVLEVSVLEKQNDTFDVQEITQKHTEVPEPEIKVSNINISELKPVVSNVIFSEGPKEESLHLPHTSEKSPHITIENCPFAVALSLAILLAGPKESSINIPSIIASQAKTFIETPNLTVAEVLARLSNGPKDSDLKIPEIKEEQGGITVEEFISLIRTIEVPLEQHADLELSKTEYKDPKISFQSNFLTVATALAILLTGPKDGYLDIAQFNTSKAKATMEMPKTILPEYSVQVPYGPKHKSFEIPQIMKGQSNITIQEFISLVRSIVIPFDQYTDIELVKTDCKLPLISLESTFLSVAATMAVFLLGPDIENFEIAKITLENANIDFEQFRAHITSCVNFCESKEESLEIPIVLGKLPQITRENCLFVPESLVVETDGPKEGNIEITKTKREKVNILFNKLNAIQASIVLLTEYINENLKLPRIIKRQPQVSIQETVFHIANVLTVYTEEPIDEHFNVTKTVKQEARVKIEEMKAAEVKFMPLEEPEPEELVISEINKKQSQTSVESSILTVAQKLAVSFVESADQRVDTLKAMSQKASLNIETLKATETSIILSEEPKQEAFNVTQILDKKGEHSLVDANLVTAESLIVQVEESTKANLDVKAQKNQRANIKIAALKALETTIINDEEPKNEDFCVPVIELKQTEGIIEKSLKSVAQVAMITTNEIGAEMSVAGKVNKKHVSVNYESMIPVAQTIVTATEEAHDVSLMFTSISDSAKSTLVESSVTAKAEVLEKDINVLLEKPHIKKPKIEEIEIEANLKLPAILDDSVSEVSADYSVEFPKEENVYAEFDFSENKIDVSSEIYESIRLMKKQAYEKQSMDASLSLARDLQTKIDMVEIEALEEEFIRSGSISSSSSMASSPLTPIFEEYFFNIKGPYLRSRYRNIKDVFEEASLKLKSKIQKSTIQNFDASLTLILQDLAMAQLESEMNDIEVIEIEDYEDVRNLHFSTALLAGSLKQSAASFMSSEAKSFEAMQSSFLSQNAYGSSMSVMDAALEASLGGTRHVYLESTLAGEQTSSQSMIMKASQSEMDVSMQSGAKVTSNGKTAAQALISRSNNNINNKAIEAESMKASMLTDSKEKKSKKELAKVDLKIMQSVESGITDLSMKSEKKLSIRTDVDGKEVNGNVKTPSPPILPPTPLTDEYMFRLQTQMPEPSEYIPRDCSISPERLEEEIILKCGLIPHIKTKIERILYSPPYQTPPTSPDKTVPIYSKQGKSGKTGFFKFLS